VKWLVATEEPNPGYTWFVQPVLSHWATTTEQPPALTILYIYCTCATEMPRSHTWHPHSTSTVRVSELQHLLAS